MFNVSLHFSSVNSTDEGVCDPGWKYGMGGEGFNPGDVKLVWHSWPNSIHDCWRGLSNVNKQVMTRNKYFFPQKLIISCKWQKIKHTIIFSNYGRIQLSHRQLCRRPQLSWELDKELPQALSKPLGHTCDTPAQTLGHHWSWFRHTTSTVIWPRRKTHTGKVKISLQVTLLAVTGYRVWRSSLFQGWRASTVQDASRVMLPAWLIDLCYLPT